MTHFTVEKTYGINKVEGLEVVVVVVVLALLMVADDWPFTSFWT